MPCMLLEDGAAPANACMALGSIADVMASWFAGSILEDPSASIMEPSLVMDSYMLEAEEPIDELRCADADADGTTGGRGMDSL